MATPEPLYGPPTPAVRRLHQVVKRWERSLGAPGILLFLVTGWFAWRFSALVIQRHNEFGSFDYDLGIYDQGIWLLARGRQMLTVRGLPFLGHHWNPAAILYIPAYWLGAGPNLLNASQAVAVAAGAIPTFFATRKLTKSGWIALLVALTYLGHPSSGWIVQELFHPETMAIPFVLGAWAFAEHEKWRWYAIAVVCSLLWKEDIALAIAMLGVAVVWRKNHKYGVWTFIGATVYFLIATKLIIPGILGRSAFYEDLFGPLGSSATDLAKNAVIHPSRFTKALREHGAEKYASQILRPYGYVSLLNPSSLLIGLPQYLINLFSTLSFLWDPRYHYVAMPTVAATIGSSRAIGTRQSSATRWGVCALAVVFCVGVRDQGIGPWSAKFDDGNWPRRAQSLTPVYRKALTFVPNAPDVVTSSPYFLTPHLTHRFEAYTFPNPWRASYWGVHGENPRSGDRVDYVIMNEAVLGSEDRATYDASVVKSGQFVEVFRSDPVVVWRRAHPAPPPGPAPLVQATVTSVVVQTLPRPTAASTIP